MGTSLDSGDDRHANVGYVFQNLKTLVVNLAPNAGIGDIAERGPIDISNKLPACSRQNHNLVLAILGDPVKGVDKFCMRLRGHNERPAVAVEFSNQHTVGIARELQVGIGSEVLSVKCFHSVLLSDSPALKE